MTLRQTKDFAKFLGIVVILFFGEAVWLDYCRSGITNFERQGFLTTFTMLARDSFTAKEIWWMMVKVFFG